MSTIQEWYNIRRESPSDINEHMPLLKKLAEGCGHITEFGTRTGNSTVALLAGLDEGYRVGMRELVSYDINAADIVPPVCAPTWTFNRANTKTLPDIADTDLLFIDTLHDAEQVAAELMHARRVRSWLVFHDTVLFGCREESTNQGPGICHAIWQFLATVEGEKWRVWSHDANNCGLLVLRRRT
jgi:hypothetical protein